MEPEVFFKQKWRSDAEYYDAVRTGIVRRKLVNVFGAWMYSGVRERRDAENSNVKSLVNSRTYRPRS